MKKNPVLRGVIKPLFECLEMSPEDRNHMYALVETHAVDRAMGILAAVYYLDKKGIQIKEGLSKAWKERVYEQNPYAE